MTAFDLNLLPIHRLNGQDYPDLPGLFAFSPSRKSARGREKDNLILYLMLSGNTALSNAELERILNNAANAFYQSAGSLTSAMRKGAEFINSALLERNLSTTGRGQYALGWLVLAVVRETQCTLLLSGPAHAVWVTEGQARHIHDPALSGKGLGSSQSMQTYLSQIDLHAGDLLVLCGKFPRDWEADLLGERPPASLDASYRKLTFTKGDLHAALIQPQTGRGVITILHADVRAPAQPPPAIDSMPQDVPAHEAFPPEPDLDESPFPDQSPIEEAQFIHSPVSETPPITEEKLDEMADFAAHMLQPSAYAIPPQPEELSHPLPKQESASTPTPSIPRSLPLSIPRLGQVEQKVEEPVLEPVIDIEMEEEPEEKPVDVQASPLTEEAAERSKPNAHAEATRQMAKVMVGGIQVGRRFNESLQSFLRRFIPRLLPGAEHPEGEPRQQQMFFMPTYAMVFIAIVIPVLVVTIASIVYLRFGQSVQYDELFSQALNARAQALSESEPARQRDAWQSVLNLVDQASTYRETDESNSLRAEAQSNLDSLMGVTRLVFYPAFANGLGGSSVAQISRMAASESDLYMLDAQDGKILHAAFTGQNLQLDSAFNCQPGTYAGYQVGTLVDLLALPKVNAAGATVLGVDATGNLLYCASGQVPQAIPLPSLPNTNWGRITSFVLDGGNLYVLDATSRSVWVFVGKDGAFVDTPYFYFGNQIPDTIDTAIDLAVGGDDLYLLHADGHVSTCTFSRIAETPTRCIDPLDFQDPFPAHQDINVFAQAHFTQMSLTTPPNSVILLLDSENQRVFRFTPRSLELQNQITGFSGKANPFQVGDVAAMTVNPNYVLFLSIGDQVYFAANIP